MVGVRLYRGDKVLHASYDGVWKVWSNHPRSGWVWLEPVDHIAKTVALFTEHGMLGAQRSKLVPHLLKEQDHGIR